jgi:hypothetical protein
MQFPQCLLNPRRRITPVSRRLVGSLSSMRVTKRSRKRTDRRTMRARGRGRARFEVAGALLHRPPVTAVAVAVDRLRRMPGDLLRIDGELVMVADREPSPEIRGDLRLARGVELLCKFILIGQPLRAAMGPTGLSSRAFGDPPAQGFRSRPGLRRTCRTARRFRDHCRSAP